MQQRTRILLGMQVTKTTKTATANCLKQCATSICPSTCDETMDPKQSGLRMTRTSRAAALGLAHLFCRQRSHRLGRSQYVAAQTALYRLLFLHRQRPSSRHELTKSRIGLVPLLCLRTLSVVSLTTFPRLLSARSSPWSSRSPNFGVSSEKPGEVRLCSSACIWSHGRRPALPRSSQRRIG